MKHLFHLFKHELKTLFITPSTYIACILFLLIEGFVYVYILSLFSQTPQTTTPSFYFYENFWLTVFFVVPIITMRSIAEELRLGTMATLLTTPVNSFCVVLAKFLSCYVLYLLLWSLTFLFPYIAVWTLESPQYTEILMNKSALTGTFLFIAITGTFYIAIGILCSSLTRSQLVSSMLTFCFLFIIIIGAELLNYIPFLEAEYLNWIKNPIEHFQSFELLNDFNRGILDSRPLFLYTSSAFLTLGISSIIIKSKA